MGILFVPVNRGALPDQLIGNALFAQSGTLLLDEIDPLTQKAQVVLLRFLQDQEFRPFGKAPQADLRIVARRNQSFID